MIKLIAQLVLAASITGLVPADAAQLEWAAGVENGLEFGHLPIAQVRQLYSGLPISETAIDYPVKVDVDSYGVVTTAQSALVIDETSGMMMYAKRPDQVRSIGSVTKLMSALVFLDQDPDLSRIVELDPDRDLVYGGRIYLHFRDGLALDDVLGASLVGSDNSATKSLARFSGLSEADFVKKMNEKAVEFGMENSHFADLTGLDARNVSTARDLTKLLAAAEQKQDMKKYMMSESIVITQASGRSVQIENTNGVLGSYLNEGEYAVEAGKTGYLPQAGYVLTTIMREGEHRIFVIVLGAESLDARVNEVKGLAAWAFKTFRWPEEL